MSSQAIKRLFRSMEASVQTLLGNRPRLPVTPHQLPLIKLGSDYGGWTYAEMPNLRGATVISCGLGEDASFDVEFAARYGARVVVADPTPRAIRHFELLKAHTGAKATSSYTRSGAQPIGAYDLSKITADSLALYPKALWNESKPVDFFLPADASHVSHSIVNFQNEYRTDTASITVHAVPLDILMRDLRLTAVPLLKLDIEGAEIEVILDMLAKRVFPDQVLVEFDELSAPSKRSKERIQSAHEALVRNGYCLVNFDHPANCLYTRPAQSRQYCIRE
jgi:FkbM family methyltransferase